MKGGNDSRAQDGTASRLEHSEFGFLYIFLSAHERMHVYVYNCYISERACRDQRPKLVSIPVHLVCVFNTGSLSHLDVTKEADLAA